MRSYKQRTKPEGDKNPNRGNLGRYELKERPGYQAIHAWVRKIGGKASYCEKEDDTCKGKFEWSNISHEYRRDINDYQQLCSSHHVIFDKAFKNKQRKWYEAHLHAANGYAKLSHAKRLQVGALLIKDNRIISTGVNGTPTGDSNRCEDELGNTLPTVVHAEANVILFAAKNGMATNNCTLITTHSPCFACCQMIIQAGIRSVYYNIEYRDITGLEFLTRNNIEVHKIGD